MKHRQLALCGILPFFLIHCSSGSDVLVGYNRGDASGGATGGGATGLASLSTGRGGSHASIGESSSSISTASGGAAVSSGADRCENGGPDIALPIVGGCTTDLAKRLFLFAVCTCGDFEAVDKIATDSFDSRVGGGFSAGASIGCNGTYQGGDVSSRLGGSLFSQGAAEFGSHDIAGDLQCGNSVTVNGVSRVHRNAYVAGDLAAPSFTIDGDLSLFAGASQEVKSVGGQTLTLAEKRATMPCDCDKPVDIGAIVRSFASNNDNDVASVASGELAATEGKVERTLPCGRYYFDSVGGTGAITLHLTGKTLIAVGERLSNSTGLYFDLSPNAELDLFVAGDLELSGPLTLGLATRPAATRVYLAGQAAFSNNLSSYANWYIPNMPLAMSAPSEFWGSIFAESLHSAATLSVHYDQSVIELPSCNAQGQGCTSCRECANPTPACRNGKCEACVVDSDCCPPLYCNQGRCQIAPPML